MKRPAEIMSDDDVRQLLAQCSRRAPTGIRDRALITVLYRAGLRVGEALALRQADLDAQHGAIRVLHGKGDKARIVGIGDGALAVLQLWLDARRDLGIRRTAPLFCTLGGGPLSANQVRQMMKRRAARAGLDMRVHPHGLRHSHAFDLAVKRGVPAVVVQQQLGHERLATTEIYLRHVAPEAVLAVGRSDNWTDE